MIFCFRLIKDIARFRKDLKVLISSATVDAEKFADYFGCSTYFVPGRRFPVDILHTKVFFFFFGHFLSFSFFLS